MIEINIPFAEVINQIPNYAKFLKEILNKKRKIAEEGIMNLLLAMQLSSKNEGPR